MNRLGITYGMQEQDMQINLDFRNYYMPRLNRLDAERDIDLALLIGINPRLEASLFNVSLRKIVLRSALQVITLGHFMNLTYGVRHPGNGPTALMKIALGKASIIKNIVLAERPIAVFGFENMKREDGIGCSMLDPIFEFRNRFIRASLLGGRSSQRRRSSTPIEINMISTNVSLPIACELGFSAAPGAVGHERRSSTEGAGLPRSSTGAGCVGADSLYLIGADSEKISAKN